MSDPKLPSTPPETPASSPTECADTIPQDLLVWEGGNPFDRDSPFERRRTRFDEDFGEEPLSSPDH